MTDQDGQPHDRNRPTAREGALDERARPTTRDAGAGDRARSTTRDAPGDRSRETRRDSTAARVPRRRFTLPEALAERYVYEADIQAGSQAAVLLCSDRETGEQVAVKLYLGDGVIDSSVIDTLTGGDTRHVVPSRLERADGEQWEVMEYFPLGSLHEHLHDPGGAPRGVTFTREFLIEMVDAIEYLHTRDVVHRDLKPGNVLVRSLAPLDLVIGDFGVSIRTAGTAAASVRGTWAYAPPEASYGAVSKTGDWWPIGVMAHELLTGRHPLADPVTGLLPPDLELRVLLGRGAVGAESVHDERWRMLLDGLLTVAPDKRWGAAQVREWLAGRSPAVWRDRVLDSGPQPVPAKVKPFVLGGTSFTEPAALAQAMTQHWEEASDRLAGRGVAELREFLRDTGTPPERIPEIADRGTPSFVMLAMQGAFLPGAAPAFQGRPLDGGALGEVASAAQRGDENAAAWIRDLRMTRVLGEATRYSPDAGRLAVADERLTQWWAGIDRWLAELERDREIQPLLAKQRGALEGRMLLAALDDEAAAQLRAAARRAGDTGAPVAAWAARLLSETRGISTVADTATAAVATIVLEPAQAMEHDRLEALKRAEAERIRDARDRAREAERRRRAALLTARRARAGREFWRRLWIIVPFGLIAGWLSTVPLGTWDMPFARAEYWTTVALAGGSALALSLAVFLWETFVDRVRLNARTPLLISAALTSLALWWADVWVASALWWPGPPPMTGATWWLGIPVVFALFFAIAVVLSVITRPRDAITPERAVDDRWWSQDARPRRLRLLARWTIPAVVLAGIATFGHAAALIASQLDGSVASTVAGMAPSWVYDVGVVLDDSLPDLDLGHGTSRALFATLAVFCVGLTMPALSRDVARRSAPLAYVLLVLSLVACLAVTLASPWEIVFAGSVVAFGIIGVVVIGIVVWIIASVLG